MIIFLFGGSGNIQSWNEFRQIDEPREDVEVGQTKKEPVDTTKT